MTRIILVVLLQIICATGFSQDARWRETGSSIPAHADLDVRWNAPTNQIPSSVWIYHLLPRKLSPEIISNLMSVCSFTEKDETKHGDLLIFNSSDGSRCLRVSWPIGIIDYIARIPRSPTNLVKNVPSQKRAVRMTRKLLPELGINFSELSKEQNSSKPRLISYQGGVTYFLNRKAIKNTESCAVRFDRAVDGMEFVGAGYGGDGEIDFGGNGKVTRILITWRNMERYKSFPTVTPKAMIQSLREGKAVQGPIPLNVGYIDWRTVKSVTVRKMRPCYYGGNPFSPSDWLTPYAALETTLDTGHGNIDVEIDCPIIDETKL